MGKHNPWKFTVFLVQLETRASCNQGVHSLKVILCRNETAMQPDATQQSCLQNDDDRVLFKNTKIQLN